MQQFELRLKNEKIPTYNRISWIIVVANILGLAACAVYFPEPLDKFYSTVALALIFLLLFLRFYFKKISSSLGFLAFFVVFILTWILLGLYWVAGVVLLFAILHTISTRDLKTIFSNEHIRYPSFPGRTIEWTDLNNTILKDGLLTIDLRNNRIIQQHIDEKLTPVNEREFNEFCSQQLKK